MNKKLRFKTRRKLLLIGGLVLLAGWATLLLQGGALQPAEQVEVTVRGQRTPRTVAEVSRGQLTPALFDADYGRVAEMALLSAVVYSGRQPADNRPDYAEAASREKYAVERRELAALGWDTLSFRYPLVAPTGKTKAKGLTYDVWVREEVGQAPLAVLVFRGTDYLEPADWQANARPLTNTPGVWDQYEQVRALTPVLLARLDAVYGGRQRVFAAGHSLGGGLAQHAAYTNKQVEKVFAFNSSPLTGYFDVPAGERVGTGTGQRTFLVYESNEALALVRFVPGLLRNLADRVDVVMVRYNFSGELDAPRPVRQHAMQRLVAGLLSVKS